MHRKNLKTKIRFNNVSSSVASLNNKDIHELVRITPLLNHSFFHLWPSIIQLRSWNHKLPNYKRE